MRQRAHFRITTFSGTFAFSLPRVINAMKMFIKGSVLLLALLLCARYIAHSSTAHAFLQDQREKKDSESISPEQLAHAKTTFGERCARCHGADGRGQTVLGGMLGVPNFTDEKWWKEEKSDTH